MGISAWRTAAASVLALGLLTRPAQAQTIDEIVARHIEARGGKARLSAIQTIKLTRTVATGIGTPLKVVVYKKRPNLMRLEQASAQPGATVIPRAINPEVVWDTVQGKPVPRPDQIAAETRDVEGDFDGLLVDWKDKGHSVVLDGREKSAGGEAYKLTVTLKSGLKRTIYLDAQTFLERRHTGVLNLPGGRQFDVIITFDNWRDVEGVKFPFDITEERTGKEPVVSLVTYTETIELNIPLDDGMFAMPAGAFPVPPEALPLRQVPGGGTRQEGQLHVHTEEIAAAIASAERSISDSLVCQLLTEIRIAGSPSQRVPPHQQVPSAWTAAMTPGVTFSPDWLMNRTRT